MHRLREEGTRAIMADSIIIEIPSDYKYLNLVDLVCGEIVYAMGFKHEAANQIAISVIEACTNALEHGNQCCPEKNVRATFTEFPDRLLVEVFDFGEGFDHKSYLQHIPDPSDIHKLRGRGIYIMNNMMDRLSFQMIPGKGMKVSLEKMLPNGRVQDS